MIKIKTEVIDYDALMETFDNDEEFISELMSEFAESVGDFSDRLKSSAKSGSYDEMSRIAHTVKGTGANLMCGPLTVASKDLELFTKDMKKKDKDKIDRNVNLVLHELDRVLKAIQTRSTSTPSDATH